MTYQAIEFDSADEALQHANAASGEAILLYGQPLVVSQDDAHRLHAAGVEFAYLVDHDLPDGTSRILSIPVN